MKLLSHERKKNIKNAFALLDAKNERRMTNILLIDDVWTTGSTLKECCYVLKRNGAKKVWALTIAR
jgi:predicted amidophosphoribosyltransferase